MQFTIDDLSENDLTKIGLSKNDIRQLPKVTYNALMSGGRTTLMRITKNENGTSKEIDAKISLSKKENGETQIHLHPVNAIAQNVFNLGADQTEALESGKKKFIKTTHVVNGEEKKLLVYFDKDTNEYIGIEKNKIKPPEKINGQELSPKQQQDLKDGKEITIDKNKFRLDPTHETGIRSSQGHVQSVEWEHSKYDINEMTFDLIMTASGLGSVVLIGHMADLLLHTFNNQFDNNKVVNRKDFNRESLSDKNLRNALVQSFPEIKKQIEKEKNISPQKLKTIIENHLNRPVELENINVNALNQSKSGAGQNVQVEDNDTHKKKPASDSEQLDSSENMSTEAKKIPQETIILRQPKRRTMRW